MPKKPAMRAKKPIKKRRFRIIPFTMSMLALLLSLKVSEIYFDVKSIRDAVAEAPAAKEEEHSEAEKPAADHEEATKEEHKEAEKKDDAHKEEAKDDGHGGGHGEAKPAEEPKTAGAGKMTIKEVEAMKAKNQAPLYTKEELDLLQNLTKRRQELEQREQELVIKSKILEATEKRIGSKITEMQGLKDELSQVVAEHNKQQESQLGSLVKIYENMKPGDAAAIFNEMEMPILLEVIGKMSERKVAPVLANMSPKKAKDVTQELAEMRRKDATKKAAAITSPQTLKN